MTAAIKREEARKEAAQAARAEGSQATQSVASGRNDPLGAGGIAPSGQVGLSRAIAWAGEFGRLALQMERNREKWRDLAESYKTAMEQMRALVQDISENFEAMPKVELEQKLRALGLRLAEVLQSRLWRADWAEAEREAEALSKKREQMVQTFLDEVGKLRRSRA